MNEKRVFGSLLPESTRAEENNHRGTEAEFPPFLRALCASVVQTS